MVSLTPRYCRSAPDSAIQAPPTDHAGERHRRSARPAAAHPAAAARRGRGQRPHQQRAFAADDHQAELRRQRRAQRREDERRGAGQRVLPGEPGAERALVHVEIEVERVLAEQRDEDAERDERRQQRTSGMTMYSAAPPSVGSARRIVIPTGAAERCWSRRSSAGGRVRAGSRLPPPTARATSCTIAATAEHRPSRGRSDDAFDQVVHLLELGVGLAAIDAGGDHGLALVVLERALEDDVVAGRRAWP